jgi:3-oxoadipate enol-lactonase
VTEPVRRAFSIIQGGELTTDLVETSRGTISREVIGEGPDLVLLHSLLTDRNAFDPIIPALSGRWRVQKVDLPGFGQSTRCEPTIDSFAESIGALLASGGFDPLATALLGNGFGAFVALGVAIRHPASFGRLVLIGCGTGFGPAGQVFEAMAGKVLAGGMRAVVDIALRRIFTENYLADHPAEATQRSEVLLRTDPESFTLACRALQMVDYSELVSQVSNPTLIAAGSEDQATPPPMGRRLAELMPAASFYLLPGLAHAPQLQDPEALLRVVGSFLELGEA